MRRIPLQLGKTKMLELSDLKETNAIAELIESCEQAAA
jgi:hypothetical protein